MSKLGGGSPGGAVLSTLTDIDYSAIPDYPMVGAVLSGATYDNGNKIGTLVLPDDNEVLNGVVFGVDGNGSTGTLVLPDEANVQDGIQYGAGGTQYTGTYNPLSTDYPAVTDVRYGVSYDSGSLVGTLTLPAVGDVQSGVQFGAGGTEYTGTFVVPTEAQVEEGVQYGAGGTEFTGTLTGGAGAGYGLVTSTYFDIASTSAYASKGAIYDCIQDVSLNYSVQFMINTAASYTYKFTIARLNSTDKSTIEEILAQTASQSPADTYSDSIRFTFSDVTLTAGNTYAFILTRTDGTATSVCYINYSTSAGYSDTFLSWYGGVRYASILPSVSDSVLYSTTTCPTMIIGYEV